MVRVEDFQAGTPGSNPSRHIGIFFPLKFKRLMHFDNMC